MIIRAIIHFFGIDTGAPYGHWVPYGFWSGVAGSFLTNALAFGLGLWWKSTCHNSWRCWRHGKYQAAGGTFKLCWRHHPDMGQRPHSAMIRQLHTEWKAKHHSAPGRGEEGRAP